MASTTVHVSPRTAVIPVYAAWGAAAAVVGGIGMGIWMSVSKPLEDMAMIKMVAMLLGTDSAFSGWLIHMAIAITAGLVFGALLGQWAVRMVPAVGLGLVYGVVWWIVGALWIMPANMGMPVFELNDVTRSSLGAHLVFGLLLGLAFSCIARVMGKHSPGTSA
ncbi:hypothetical protein [Streptomyces gobiensis]|uniref:hypothetical protein n=1 Tax=Streptomyces gobiensis TaxID=2875706 RepID=UPI001E62BD45|nr:hypothetical protein [Streptomyces gobiensis]UGY91486.1 hypothetical protein test1122_06970 [Streptomyces gobiensis]